MAVQSILDILETYWPPSAFTRKTSTEYGASCPFCPSTDDLSGIIYNNHSFVGSDRFVINTNSEIYFCRECQREGRGRGGRGVYTLQDLAQRFSFKLDESFLTVPEQTVERHVLQSLQRTDVSLAHTNVDRTFWNAFGWTDEIINKFRLGKITLYDWMGEANLIPMDVRTSTPGSLIFNYFELRQINDDGSKIVRHGSGSNHDYFWFKNDDPGSNLVLITEGAKDAISGYMLGFKNFLSHFGSTKAEFNKIEFLKQQGFTTLIVAGDKDSAGFHFNESICGWAAFLGLDVYYINYPDTLKEGYDVSNLLKDNPIQGKNVLLSYLAKYVGEEKNPTKVVFDETRSSYVEDMRKVISDFEANSPQISDLDTIRGTSPGSLDFFIRNYVKTYGDTQRAVACLSAPPGAGKTFTLTKIVQEVAVEEYTNRLRFYSDVEDELNELNARLTASPADTDEYESLTYQIDRLKHVLEEKNFTSVLWSEAYKNGIVDLIRLGINPDYWFDFEARNTENCKNYDLTLTLGENNHDIGYFCEVACPFKTECKANGYLSQHEKKKQYPITIVRHQHLINDALLRDYNKLVVIDESLLNVVNTPSVFVRDDLDPFQNTWWMDVQDSNISDMMTAFVNALKDVLDLSYSQETDKKVVTTLSGMDLYNAIEMRFTQYCEGQKTFKDLLEVVFVDHFSVFYQPTYVDGERIGDIKKRALPVLYEIFLDELPEYLTSPGLKKPSKLHVYKGKLEVYPVGRIKAPSKVPIIVADATLEMPELYTPVFGREVLVYKPNIRNPLVETNYIINSDWTRTTHRIKLGKVIDEHKKIRSQTETITALTGETYDLNTVGFSFDDVCSGNSMYEDYEASIVYLADKHNSLLVIVHLYIQKFLEDLFAQKYPKLSSKIRWGHFNALRGTNEFQTFEAVAMFGVHRIPYDSLWREIQAWANRMGVQNEIPYEFVFTPKDYHTRYDGHTYRTFTDPFAAKYLDMVEVGEMRQSVERIRPHSSSGRKYVYVFSNRPGILYVNGVYKKSRFIALAKSNSVVNDVYRFMLDTYKKTGKLPTKRDTMLKYGCGYPVYKSAKTMFSDAIDRGLIR